jgi:Ran GTPase-activating protein (RanGAP) involved in mRNA processing and transport
MELFLKKNTLLKTISIASNKIGIDTIKILSSLINSNQNLTSINLNNCSIDRNGCKILFNSISQTNSSLVYLNLGKNQLNIKSIVSCLELNTSLVYLNLSDTMKFNSDFIVSQIAKALEKNKTLRELDLSMNYITTNGSKSIGRMLLVNRTLTDIHLNNNRIASIKWLDVLKTRLSPMAIV